MPDSEKVIVYKNRKNVLPISIGYDVSADTITSEIRTQDGTLIATWTVTFDSDGVDGEIILTLESTDTDSILYASGLMDLKRVRSGDPYPVFAQPLEVDFIETVTV